MILIQRLQNRNEGSIFIMMRSSFYSIIMKVEKGSIGIIYFYLFLLCLPRNKTLDKTNEKKRRY